MVGNSPIVMLTCRVMFGMRLFLLLLLALTACKYGDAAPLLQLPTATTVRVEPSTLVPTVARRAQAAPVISPAAQTGTTGGCEATAGQATVVHTVNANLNYDLRALIVDQRVRLINRSNDALAEIVLNVEPNQWPDMFTLDRVWVGPNAAPAAYDLTGRRLSVMLPAPLEPGCALEVRVSYRLDVPRIGDGIRAYRGYLAHSPRQLNLGNWLLTVAPRIDGQWVTREAVLIGEQTIAEIADWDVTFNVSAAPETLIIAGPGKVSHVEGEHVWRFFLTTARDFTVSLSDVYNVTSIQTPRGVRVELYTFDDALTRTRAGRVDAVTHALDVAARSVDMFSDLYGDYPYDRLVVIQADFPDGMEFSGLVFVGGNWFIRFPGRTESYLTLITVHEIAHQWWYGIVGSDQALSPWLDEALATYSEYVFIEEYYPDLKDWWWSFRVDNFAPSGVVDQNVYQFSSVREYINAVYLLGARMLHDLRRDLGTNAFYDLLRRYAEAGSGRIATPELFWSLLSPEQLEAVEATRHRYFEGF